MSAGWLIYWITRLDSIKDFLGWVPLVLILAVPAIFLMVGVFVNDNEYGSADDDKWRAYLKKYKKIVFSSLVLGAIFIIINVFLPSSKELAIMIGIDKLSTSPQVNDVLNQLYQTIMKLLQSAG